MEKIKLAHVQVLPKLTGVQLFSVQLFSALPDSLYEKYIIMSSAEKVLDVQRKELVDRLHAANVNIIWIDSLKRSIGAHDITCFIDLYKLFKNYRFDIVHTNSTKPGILARIAARLAGAKKVVHTVHGIAYHAHIPSKKRITYYLLEVFSSIFGHYTICVNKFYVHFYQWIPTIKLMTIYNGIDFKVFDTVDVDRMAPECKYREKKNFKILFIGRLDEQKDPLTLLNGFKLLLQQYGSDNFEYTLSIVGHGELYQDCRQYCVDNGLEEFVTLHGWSTDTAAYYQSADLFVCPSIYEAFGYTFVEAAYCGLPIVASNVEGIPEVVIDGEMGFLVPARSPQHLADAIHRIISNPDLYERFSRNARSSVAERFNVDQMVGSYRKVYEGNDIGSAPSTLSWSHERQPATSSFPVPSIQ